jgi:hypothetical protein
MSRHEFGRTLSWPVCRQHLLRLPSDLPPYTLTSSPCKALCYLLSSQCYSLCLTNDCVTKHKLITTQHSVHCPALHARVHHTMSKIRTVRVAMFVQITPELADTCMLHVYMLSSICPLVIAVKVTTKHSLNSTSVLCPRFIKSYLKGSSLLRCIVTLSC